MTASSQKFVFPILICELFVNSSSAAGCKFYFTNTIALHTE